MKPLQLIIFRPVGDYWMSADGVVLADYLASYDIIVDDRCEFARFSDYERRLYFIYRETAGKITITVWRIHKL